MKKTFVVLLAMAFVLTGSSFLVPDKINAAETTPSVEVAGPVKMSKKAIYKHKTSEASRGTSK